MPKFKREEIQASYDALANRIPDYLHSNIASGVVRQFANMLDTVCHEDTETVVQILLNSPLKPFVESVGSETAELCISELKGRLKGRYDKSES